MDNTLMQFFVSSYEFLKANENDKSKLRKLIGSDLVKKRGEYWYWGVSELKNLKKSDLEKLILKIQRNTPPYVSDDFQIGYDGAFENYK